MNADSVADAVRLEREPVPDVPDDLHAGEVLEVGVDPSHLRKGSATPVQPAHRPARFPWLSISPLRRLGAQLHRHSTSSRASSRVRTLRESKYSCAISRAQRACAPGYCV